MTGRVREYCQRALGFLRGRRPGRDLDAEFANRTGIRLSGRRQPERVRRSLHGHSRHLGGHDEAVPAAFFGYVQCGVGGAQQFLR